MRNSINQISFDMEKKKRKTKIQKILLTKRVLFLASLIIMMMR